MFARFRTGVGMGLCGENLFGPGALPRTQENREMITCPIR